MRWPGRTALHWAAAVNNVEALLTLLQRDANKDVQDSYDQTPLFLAAREGSREAVRALLDAGANRDIADHMDRLPRHVATERLHHDIAQMLDDLTTPRRYQTPTDGLLSKGKQKKGTDIENLYSPRTIRRRHFWPVWIQLKKACVNLSVHEGVFVKI